MTTSNDYQRIERVIRFLDKHRADQPDLGELARQVSLSPFHFHRLFTSWAGITPKEFLQCLTAADVRRRLREGESVLSAALEAGLSGPGRLHDLCVTVEAASPGEIKSGGAGWTMSWGFADTPFGRCLIAGGPRGLCALSFVESDREDRALASLRRNWPCATWERDDAHATRTAHQVFQRRPSEAAPLRAFVKGSAFQVRVWRALLSIPPNAVTTYGKIAAAIGQPAAARAVGSAIGQNALAYLIPCHRVIRETGVIGDYRWGSARKRAMLAWESVPATVASS